MTGENALNTNSDSASEIGSSGSKKPICDAPTKLQIAALDETQPMEVGDSQSLTPTSSTSEPAKAANNTPCNSPGSSPGIQLTSDAISPEQRISEIQAAELALERRRLDLERQTLLLAARLQQVFEREKRLAGMEAEKLQLEEEKKELQKCRAELDHLKEIMDLEFTRDRKILVQERLQIARMRESLRLEGERIQAERGRDRNTQKLD